MIKANSGTPGIMWQAADGDLSAITLLDTDPITPTSWAWEIEYWPDNLASAPTVANSTGNPATFTPPQAGEWYQVLLTRTIGAASFQVRLQICIPDATGTYALPAPGMQADTDPTKTLVNKNSAAKAIGWAGGVRATMPGFSGAVRKALDDAAAANIPASSSMPGTQSINHFNRTDGQWLSIAETGYDLQAAHDILPSAGGSIQLPDGDHTYTGVVFTKPVRLFLGRGTITFTNSVGIETSRNIYIIGQKQNQSVLVGATDGTIIKLGTPWGDTNPEGGPAFYLGHCTLSGGAKHIDANPNGDMSYFGFAEGDFHVENVTFYQSTNVSVTIADSTYYGRLTRCQWVQCFSSLKIGAYCETKITHCILKMADGGGPSVELIESHHTEFQFCQFYGQPSNVNPDVLLRPLNNGTAGYCLFDRCKFGPEREYWMNSARHRIELADTDIGNEHFGMSAVRIRFCEFLGPPALTISSIGRASNVATATISSPNAPGHGMLSGESLHIMFSSDASFAGENVLTSVTTNTVSWASTGADVPQSAFGGNAGIVASAMVSAIKWSSPPFDWVFEENRFENYAYGVDDDFAEKATGLGRQGTCVWGNSNFMTGNVSTHYQEFKIGGHNLTHLEPGPTSPLAYFDSQDKQRETPEIRNRVIKSQTLDTWTGNIGLTLTAGQADPWGGATATKLARTAAAAIVADGGGDSWTSTEALTCGFDQTGMPGTVYLSFWAKKGSTRSLFVMVKDGGGFAHFAQVINLGASWKRYKFPVTFNSGSFTYQLVLSPGHNWKEFGDCYVTGVQISDYDSDYYPTTTVELHDTTIGARYTRKLLAAGGLDTVAISATGAVTTPGVKASGSAPTVSSVVDALGSTGTMTLATGSKDVKGTIILTAGGSGIGNYAWPKLVFTRTLSNPSFKATLRAGSGTWGGGVAGLNVSTVQIFSSGVDTAEIGFIATNASFDGGTGLTSKLNFTSGSTYLIDYEVLES